MRLSLIVLAAALAGCGTWTKPGGTAAQLQADQQACSADAWRAHPPSMMSDATWPTATTAPDRRCASIYGDSQCASLEARKPGTQADLNAGARSNAFDSCLKARGYTFSTR